MADQKITQLDNASSPVDTDLLTTVQNVSTTPVNRKITWTTIKAFLKTYFDTLYDVLGSASGVQDNLTSHENDTNNPHEVTYTQAGADPAGSASGVQDNLTSHENDTTAHGATGANVGTTNTQTLSNKRISLRVGSTSSSATPTINTDNFDVYRLTALAVDITSFTTNLTGTPNHDDSLIIELTDNGTPRSITLGSAFESSGNVTPPSTTVASTLLRIKFLYNSATSKWTCVAFS